MDLMDLLKHRQHHRVGICSPGRKAISQHSLQVGRID
jgi:hypothetical protein